MIPLRSTERVHSNTPVVIGLILVNLAIFIYEITLSGPQQTAFITRYGMIPNRLQWADLLTSMFLHGGWLHILGNMWFLWIYGRNVEDILGPAKFVAFYLVCGLAAGLLHLLLNPYSRLPTVGASGAIAGVMGAYLIRFPRARIITLVPIIVFLTTLEIPAALLLLYWFAIQFFSGVGSVGTANLSQGGTAWFAHIGGFVAGMLLILPLRSKKRFQRWD